MSEITAMKTEPNTAREVNYIHIYNRGVNGDVIFKDSEDYERFIDFLRQYLTPPPDEKDQLTTFVIRGKEYKGKPHIRKNYNDKLQLIAYSLEPDHYHLLFQQHEDDSDVKLMRSFGTRYSMYFNKRHNRSGPLFTGSYKSTKIKNKLHLPHLTRYLHQHSEGITNYHDFTQEVSRSWINTQTILEVLEKASSGVFNGVNGYKNFVENYSPGEYENEILGDIIIEEINKPVTLQEYESDIDETIVEESININDEDSTSTSPIETVAVVKDKVTLQPRQPQSKGLRIPEIMILAVTFVALLLIGLRNVKHTTEFPNLKEVLFTYLNRETVDDTQNDTEEPIIKESQNNQENQETLENRTDINQENISEETPEENTPINEEEQPSVQGVSDEQITNVEKVEILFEARVSSDLDVINVRQAPSAQSEIVLEATKGDTFEFLSMEKEWCKIKTKDGNMGYIFAEFVTIAREQK